MVCTKLLDELMVFLVKMEDTQQNQPAEPNSNVIIANFPQFILQAACMVRIIEGQDSVADSCLYDLTQCAKTILTADLDPGPGTWDSHDASDVEVTNPEEENTAKLQCQPGGSPDFVYGMIVEQINESAANNAQASIQAGSPEAKPPQQQPIFCELAPTEPMLLDSEPIPSSLTTQNLMIDQGNQSSKSTAIEKPEMDDQPNTDQNDAEMDTFDADDLEVLIEDKDPVALLVEAQVHREQSPIFKQSIKPKKSVSFDLKNIEIISFPQNNDGQPFMEVPVPLATPPRRSNEHVRIPLVIVNDAVPSPNAKAPLPDDTKQATPVGTASNGTPRTSKSLDDPSFWYPRRLELVEGSCQFQAMLRGIDRLCKVVDKSQSQIAIQPKTLVLCEKATSPSVPKLARTKVEQHSISSEMAAAPVEPQPNKPSQSTQTNSVNLKKSQVFVESIPPRNNVDPDESDIPSTTITTSSPLRDRIMNDFDMSFESESDENIGHENEGQPMEQEPQKPVRSQSDEDEEEFEQQIKDILEQNQRVTRSMSKKNKKNKRSKVDEEDEAFDRLIREIIAKQGQTEDLKPKKKKRKSKKSAKKSNPAATKVPIAWIPSRSDPKQTTMSQFLKPVLRPLQAVIHDKPETPIEVIDLNTTENIRQGSQATSVQSARPPNTQKRLEHDLRMNYYGPDYETASEMIEGTPQPEYVCKRMQSVPAVLDGRTSKEEFTMNWLKLHQNEGFLAPPSTWQPSNVYRPKPSKRRACPVSVSGSEATSEKFIEGQFISSTPKSPSIVAHTTFVKPKLPARKAAKVAIVVDSDSPHETDSRPGFWKILAPNQRRYFENVNIAHIDAALNGQLTLNDMYEEIANGYTTAQAPPNVMNICGVNVLSKESQSLLTPDQFKSIHFVSTNKLTNCSQGMFSNNN